MHDLRADRRPASFETLEEDLSELKQLSSIQLPGHLFAGLAPAIVEAYRRRVAVEGIHKLRRHLAPLRITLLPAFRHLRAGELIDTLLRSAHRHGPQGRSSCRGESRTGTGRRFQKGCGQERRAGSLEPQYPK